VRQIDVAPEVAAELGAEQIERLAGDAWDRAIPCWECGQDLAPAEPAAVLLIQPVDYGQGTVRFAVHAHRGCAISEIRKVTMAELAARNALDAEESDAPDVDVVATLWKYGQGTGRFTVYPLVMFSYRGDLTEIGGGPERQDLLVSAFLAEGWHLVTGLDRTYPRAPAGWRLRYFGTREAGQLDLFSHRGLETSTTVHPERRWRLAVAEARMALVVHGSQYLADWATKGPAAVNEAVRAGSLVAAIVPVELHSPADLV
jgi:hypothetical protein